MVTKNAGVHPVDLVKQKKRRVPKAVSEKKANPSSSRRCSFIEKPVWVCVPMNGAMMGMSPSVKVEIHRRTQRQK
jgi:hypothetical protein